MVDALYGSVDFIRVDARVRVRVDARVRVSVAQG